MPKIEWWTKKSNDGLVLDLTAKARTGDLVLIHTGDGCAIERFSGQPYLAVLQETEMLDLTVFAAEPPTTIRELAQLARRAALAIPQHPDATPWIRDNWSDIACLSDLADGFVDLNGKAIP
jgi:hypothetical protein